jgi:hypothetical protein
MQKSKIKYWILPEVISHSLHIFDSYKQITGSILFSDSLTAEYKSYLLYHAPFVVVSHGNQEDPIFNYGNLMAQQLWEMRWEEFTKLPSRYSAEPSGMEERQHFLEEVARKGFSDSYSGVRKSKRGIRFRIESVLLWNLKNAEHQHAGQVALFRKWTYL